MVKHKNILFYPKIKHDLYIHDFFYVTSTFSLTLSLRQFSQVVSNSIKFSLSHQKILFYFKKLTELIKLFYCHCYCLFALYYEYLTKWNCQKKEKSFIMKEIHATTFLRCQLEQLKYFCHFHFHFCCVWIWKSLHSQFQ